MFQLALLAGTAQNLTSHCASLVLAKILMPGGHLPSRTVSSAVLSAVRVFTVVFGMGTGVSPGRIAARFPSAIA